MGHAVGAVGGALLIAGLAERAANEAILCIHDGRLAILLGVGLNLCGRFVNERQQGGGVGQLLGNRLCLRVVLKQFDGQIACGIAVTQLGVALQLVLHEVDSFLDILPVIHMDVAIVVLDRPVAAGEVFLMVVGHIAGIVLVPLANLACHLGVDASVGIEVVAPLIHVDNHMKQQVHTASALERGGYHGHAEQLTQGVDVQLVAAFLHLVKHVERAHHAQVHVDELCGEIEVALKVGGVDDVDDDVGRTVDDVAAHI